MNRNDCVNFQQWDFLRSSLVMYDPKPTYMFFPNRIKTPAPCYYATATIQPLQSVSVILKWKEVTILVTRQIVLNLLEETGISLIPRLCIEKTFPEEQVQPWILVLHCM